MKNILFNSVLLILAFTYLSFCQSKKQNILAHRYEFSTKDSLLFIKMKQRLEKKYKRISIEYGFDQKGRLKGLYIYDFSLKEFPREIINFKHLRKLYLKSINSNLKEFPDFSKLTQLETLTLFCPGLDGKIIIPCFSEKLEYMYLKLGKIESMEFLLENNKKWGLKYLDIESKSYKNLSNSFYNLKLLKNLALHCNLSKIPPNLDLNKFKSLEVFNIAQIHNPNLNPIEVKKLRKKYPNITVFFERIYTTPDKE